MRTLGATMQVIRPIYALWVQPREQVIRPMRFGATSRQEATTSEKVSGTQVKLSYAFGVDAGIAAPSAEK